MTERSDDSQRAQTLIRQLTADPDQFGRMLLGNELLTEFLRGQSIDSLKPLLRHKDDRVLRRAVWIASELPHAAHAILDDAVAALKHRDPYVRYYALDIVMLATAKIRSEQFVHVAKSVDDPDVRVAERASELLSRATREQVAGAIAALEETDPASAHLRGLTMLNDSANEPTEIEQMLIAGDAVTRRYGLALAERAYGSHPKLLSAAANSRFEDVRSVATFLLRQHSIGKSSSDSQRMI